MYSVCAALLASAALAPSADLRYFEDAALHAVQFVDRNEGWAVGDQGVIWHTIDGGKNWERQPTGVRSSLRAVHFLNPYTGWVVGREELPQGAGSVGVLLVTRDGGLKWQRVAAGLMPGLAVVRFFDDKTGLVAGDGSEPFPTGIFTTQDGGRTWKPQPGPRSPAWLAADFTDPQTGVLAGAWSRLALLRQDRLSAADVDTLGGRSLRGLKLAGNRAVAVGQGGLVLLSASGGARWGFADLGLPPEVLASCDFHGVHVLDNDIHIVGRPGSMCLHSADAGRTWSLQPTGQTAPLHGVHFVDDLNGWAVGELGTIVGTKDGGKSWSVQQRGGTRAAVLFVHVRPEGLPLDAVALLGGEEGYLTAALRVLGSDPATAAPGKASEPAAWAAAVRQAGGAAGEVLWQFPFPQHLARADRQELLQAWDRLHSEQATELLLRQLVLALRIWRPEVVVTDLADAQAGASPAETLLAEALAEAIRRAGDAKAFPDQVTQLGLKPWQVAKLYSRWPDRAGAQITLDLNEPRPRLEATLRDFAGAAAGLLTDEVVSLPGRRYFRYLGGQPADGAAHTDLMQGIALAHEGTARRKLTDWTEPAPEVLKAIRTRRNLQMLAEEPPGGLANPEQLLAQIGPELAKLPDDQAAAAAFAVASQFARQGQWPLAREAYLLMVARYPAHPLSVEAYRWLVRHNSSSEARRRLELNQFMNVSHIQIEQPKDQTPNQNPIKLVNHRDGSFLLNGLVDAREWYQGSLALQGRLAAFGPLYVADPSLQFCWQSARRNLGEFEAAQKWLEHYRTQPASDLWRSAAAAEQWILNRSGPPPRPAILCRQTGQRPYLDGKFEDDCWQGLTPLTLRPVVGDDLRDRDRPERVAGDFGTEVRLAYDAHFLYLALRCQHPADLYVEPVKGRKRDADLQRYDRVSLLLDLDRDYNTCFHLQVDQRGCVREDCWGDRRWNPRWFVAVHSEATCWQIEAAIPLSELTGDKVTVGRAWAANVVRILPGRGVQAMSLPADAEPRPEGMGLLLFIAEKKGAGGE